MADATSDATPRQKFTSFSVLDLQSICTKLEGLVQRTFGPNGQLGLVLSSSGQPLLTTTGVELLKCANFVDPVSRLIISAVIKHHDITGDNSKEFVLILVELIRNCGKLSVDKPSAFGQQRCIALKLASAFSELQQTVIPKLFSQIKLKLFDNSLATKHYSTDKILKCLVTGFVAGKFGESVNQVLIELILSLVKQIEGDLILVVDHVINYFDVTCFCVEGGPISSSVVRSGAVVCRNFGTTTHCNSTDVDFVIVQCALNYHQEGNGNTTFEVNATNVNSALQLNVNQLKKLFACYRDKGVQLVLTNQTFSQVMLYFCSLNSISVLHTVEDDELERIIALSGIVPVCDAFDTIESCNIARATAVKQIAAGTHRWVSLTFPSTLQLSYKGNKCSPIFNIKHAIIFGPNQAVSKQYGITIKNCLKCIRMWCHTSHATDTAEASTTSDFSSDVPEISKCNLLPAGGCWEFLLNHQLTLYAEENVNDEYLKTSCKLLANAILCVPETILKNSWNSYRVRFVDVMHTMNSKTDLQYIDGKTGMTMNAAASTAWEIIHNKFILLNNLLSLMRQLLRLDGILHVEKNIIECL